METPTIEELEQEIEDQQEEITSLQDQLTTKTREYKEQETAYGELEEELELNDIRTDNAEDCRRSLFFAIKELEEVESGQSSFSDKLFELRMRYCRFL